MAFKFKGVDFLGFDNLLSEDELLARDTARDFIEDNLIPIIEQCNRDGRFPRELVKPMGELGFFGATLDGYGCAGMSNVEYGLVTQELERGDSGVRSFVSVQSALVMYPIYTFGSDEQKNFWLPRLATGEKLGCFGLTEPDFGSNPGGMRTRARKDRRRLHPERRKDVDHLRHPSPTSPSSGPRSKTPMARRSEAASASAAFSSKPIAPASPPRCSRQMVAPRLSHFRPLLQDVRIPASNLLPGPAASSRRSCASTRPATASAGEPSAPPCPATTPRCNIRCCASSSATSPSPATSSCRKNSPG